ncbi:MAG TPA: hydrogenase maturation protease [Bryobacteraceae bacterium]|nr:hydrogenase maturation protease [Bryobacteraceae bacterium]
MTPEVLIIGYGNPLRGDDGAGWRAVERLREGTRDGEFGLVAVRQLTPELAEAVSRASLVLFLDAREGGTPGKVWCERVNPRQSPPGAFSHHAGPAALLAAAAAWYGRAPAGMVLSVSGESFAFREGLSLPVEAALAELVERTRNIAGKALSRRSAPCHKIKRSE